jgi:DNA-binding MarR family transcriptional regulator
VLAMIRKNPGITQKELAKKLDISTSTIHDYIKRMRLINRIRTERNGRETRCYLVELEN